MLSRWVWEDLIRLTIGQRFARDVTAAKRERI